MSLAVIPDYLVIISNREKPDTFKLLLHKIANKLNFPDRQSITIKQIIPCVTESNTS